MFFLVFVLFLDCFFNMHLCAKLQPYRSEKYQTTQILMTHKPSHHKHGSRLYVQPATDTASKTQ